MLSWSVKWYYLLCLDTPSNFDFTPFTGELYRCTLIRLKAADIDQEVKERAISCMGQIICNLGDYLQVIQHKAVRWNEFFPGAIDNMGFFFIL
jgi:hypothetical protein